MTTSGPLLSFESSTGGGLLDTSPEGLAVTDPLNQAASIVLGSSIGAPFDGSLLMAAMESKSSEVEGDSVATMESLKREEKKDGKKPAWSELKTKAGKERKRLPLACIACRRKKIRCSGEKPACKHCLRSRTPCVYKVTTRKAAPRTDYMTMLDKRLKRMEERVIKIIPDPEPNKMASIGRASVKPPAVPAQKAAGGKKRVADEAFGTEVDQWARSDAKVDNLRQPNVVEQADTRLLTDGVEHLPTKEIQEHLAETFFDNCYGQAYYLLHKPSFMRRLKAGTIPPVLILAVCGIAARFSSHPKINSDPPFLRGEPWAKPAREIAMKRYDEPNITILIVLVILCLHEFGTCQGGRSWMLGGMAIRMAASLQLHRELDHDPLGRKGDKTELNITDREIRRRAMWSCFMMDRFISSGTERPMMLDEKTIDVQLPIEESRFQMELPGITERLDGHIVDEQQDKSPAKENMGVAAYLTRTIALWGRVVQYVNLGGRGQDPFPMWHSESKFNELKKQTEQLRLSLPDRLEFSPENLRTHAAQSLGNQFLFFHVCYQHILLFLHKFAIPTRPNVAPARDMPKDFVQMAGRAAIDAAGRISELLSDASPHCLMAPFAGYCAFLSSTVHVWGIFSKNSALEVASKRNLAINVKYLSQMKRVWGVLYLMSENLRTIYRRFADAPATDAKSDTEGGENEVLNYGGWFSEYPHGVSQSDYQEPAAEGKQRGDDAALSQKSDLQTVEEFFETPTPPTAPPRKSRKSTAGTAASGAAVSQGGSGSTAPATTSVPARRPQRHASQHVPRSTVQQANQSPPSFPANLKVDPSWTGMGLPMQGAYANMPQSAYSIPGHAQHPQHPQFRRPSQPRPHTPSHPHAVSQLSPQHQRQRASFDAAHLGHHPQLNTNLDSFSHPGSAIGMFSGSPTFPSPSSHGHHPHSATVPGFPSTPFFAANANAAAGANMGGLIGKMDRQMVFSAYSTDPGVQTGLWEGEMPGEFGMDLASGDLGGGEMGGGIGLAGGAGDLGGPGEMAAGSAGAGTGAALPSSSASNTGSVNEGSAWFLPFNLELGADAFGGELGLGDGIEGDGRDAL